ncbi:DoxX family protein [Gramella sp. Hel_I_59]|uniref:DoxX family protein n=1 Tax=Gramella sp. Hel_I_59 TaxID=1249978 RepID=UPI0011504B2D|nr:DoxX family protein [Gramella sp. Hel_I_59]
MESTGSGDRAFDYVRLGFNLFLTIPIVLIWSIIDLKRNSYNKLFYWFQVIIRLTLIFAMLIYGLAKVYKGQFADHSLERLVETVGNMSPMGLAWTFMGHSFFYNIFIGFIEILGGILLIFRKTVTLGSLVIIGVMSNVLMMNLTYDIPVKLVSAHLFIMALILLQVNGQRVFDFFFKNKTIEKVEYYVPLKNTNFKKIITIGKRFLVFVVMGAVLIQTLIRFKATEQLKEKSELYGIWETQLFVKNKDILSPLLTDTYRWRYLIVDEKNKATIKKMTDSIDRYLFKNNSDLNEIIFRSENDSVSHRFLYKFINPQELELNGTIYADSISILFKRKPKSDFRLINRKFHWVNETNYNH